MMARVARKDTGPELRLRTALWHRGWRYRLHGKGLPGRPDIVFRSARVAVMVDGDFWHGKSFIDGGAEALNTMFRGRSREFWVAKIKRNIERDRQNDAGLVKQGWRVVRVWESDITHGLEGVIADVEAVLRATS